MTEPEQNHNAVIDYLLARGPVPPPAVMTTEGIVCQDGDANAQLGAELGTLPSATQVLKHDDLTTLHPHGYFRGVDTWPPPACEHHKPQERNFNISKSTPVLAHTLGHEDVEKCIWHPRTGRLMHVWPSQQHVRALDVLAAALQTDEGFGDMLRILVLRGIGNGRGRICTRPLLDGVVPGIHYSAPATGAALRRLNLALQLEACARLRPEGWSWMFNVTNELLVRMTGRLNW